MTFYEAAHSAQLAYRSGFTTRNVRTSYDAGTDTRVVVVYDPDSQRITISFRGTFSLRNWFLNLRFGGREGVHSGVAKAMDIHEIPLLNYLKEFQSFSKMVIVGHSLGGALANEWARRVWDMGYRDFQVVTFGAVRAHSKALIQESGLGHLTVRVVNNNDLVARLLGVSYDHIGRVLYFDRRGRPHRRMSRWLKLWDGIAGRLRNPFADGISDHDMDDYIELCANESLPSVQDYLHKKS